MLIIQYQLYSQFYKSLICYCIKSIKMKQAPDFHFIESQPIPCDDPDLLINYFEEQKKSFQPENYYENNLQLQYQQKVQKIQKTKKVHKLSMKSNPQVSQSLKVVKVKQKKIKQRQLVKQKRCKQPQELKQTKRKQVQSSKQKNPLQQFGHWSLDQNKLYHWFLQIHHSHFLNRNLRRMDRIFTSMSKFIQSRQAQQCRSHHQKMQKKHRTFSKILLNLRLIHYQDLGQDKVIEDILKSGIQMGETLLHREFLEGEHNQLRIHGECKQGNCQELGQLRGFNQQLPDKYHRQMLVQSVKENDMISLHKIEEAEIEVLDMESSKGPKAFFSFFDQGYDKKLPFNHFF